MISKNSTIFIKKVLESGKYFIKFFRKNMMKFIKKENLRLES
jgi:hypothetical protein